MENKDFIGIGINPEGPDLPLGLGMNLAQDPKAMEIFAKMTNKQKEDLISYLQGGVTGEEAEERMADALSKLHNNQLQF